MKKKNNKIPHFSFNDLLNDYSSSIALKALFFNIEEKNKSIDFKKRTEHAELEIISKSLNDFDNINHFQKRIKVYQKAGANVERYLEIYENKKELGNNFNNS